MTVADLLITPPRFTNAARLDPSQALNQISQGGGGRGGGGGGSGGLFGNSNSNFDNEDDDEGAGAANMQILIQLIVDTVEPDTWVQNGGEGTISPWRSQLVVRNNILVHQRLGGYVEQGG